MRVSVRLLAFGLLVVAIACGDSTEPRALPSRATLNGFWQCAEAQVFYHNLVRDVREWRSGSCVNYLNITNPPRHDSIEVQTFRIDSLDHLTRIDYQSGQVFYDSTTGVAEVQYRNGRVEVYQATPAGLTRRFEPWDFTGDGEVDSLILTYWKVQ